MVEKGVDTVDCEASRPLTFINHSRNQQEPPARAVAIHTASSERTSAGKEKEQGSHRPIKERGDSAICHRSCEATVVARTSCGTHEARKHRLDFARSDIPIRICSAVVWKTETRERRLASVSAPQAETTAASRKSQRTAYLQTEGTAH